METDAQRQELMTVEETIHALRLGRTRVNAMLRSGELASIKIGRRRLVRTSDLAQFLRECQYVPGEARE